MNFKNIGNFIKKIKAGSYAIAGSFIISAGWNWYHTKYRPHWRFVVISLATWAVAYFGFRFLKFVFIHLTEKYRRHPFWRKEFGGFLDNLFFIFSLVFLVFFSRFELLSFIYVSAVILILFLRFHYFLSLHPAAKNWLIVNRAVFLLLYFIFLVSGIFQYLARSYYILDPNAKIFNISLFRAWSMTMFWLLGFGVASLIYWQTKNFLRYFLLSFWTIFFTAVLFAWFVNLGVLFGAGLYLSPVILQHAEGGGKIIWNYWYLFVLFAIFLFCWIFIFKKFARAHLLAPKRYWLFYNFSLIGVAVLSLVGISSFRNTPESIVIKSFYDYFKGADENSALSPIILEKLKRFGLDYNLNEFFVNHKEQIYDSSDKKLLPESFAEKRPNIIIVFLESYSSRLTDVYNPRSVALTPNLKKMAEDPQTTIFKKYYNASTPTVTGLLSQLCSFLPPTGHNEITEEKRLKSHHLLCLPKILKESGGYKYGVYVTAVEKNFANKDTIFASMGVDESYGTDELKKYIQGEPLAWGYSDHQMFPAFKKIINEKADEPFLAMISTVDTHHPFNSAQDAIPYREGKTALFNAIHTTDDAFGKFWDEFKTSPLSENTIFIAIADHAVFPTAYDKKTFPDEYNKMNFYDENLFLMYIPNSVLPKEVDLYSSGLDFAPTILQMLDINVPNSFEGHSIFDDRAKYPNLLGMHEFGLFINQADEKGEIKTDYAVPSGLACGPEDFSSATSAPLSLCEFMEFYKWKRRMLEEGRFWEK
ncbi:MAG: sulfatase-like hydrolase/transferase [Patescibacteria group bacterium]